MQETASSEQNDLLIRQGKLKRSSMSRAAPGTSGSSKKSQGWANPKHGMRSHFHSQRMNSMRKQPDILLFGDAFQHMRESDPRQRKRLDSTK
ncbi:hypothetical protein [Ureibacillus terrenus]|uniref:hypothetical protein n=1 Tax=Ureibacillus terrenus TaxID=118246 RepID=UPI002E225EE5|nr:hypothetical protein [Ureibacillus terrenus]